MPTNNFVAYVYDSDTDRIATVPVEYEYSTDPRDSGDEIIDAWVVDKDGEIDDELSERFDCEICQQAQGHFYSIGGAESVRMERAEFMAEVRRGK